MVSYFIEKNDTSDFSHNVMIFSGLIIVQQLTWFKMVSTISLIGSMSVPGIH